MESLGAIFATSFLVGFSGAATPGPMISLVIKESARRGISAGPLVVLGHALLELATVAAILAGLGTLFEKPLFFAFTGIAGGAMLIWMAYGMFKSLPGVTLDLKPGEGGDMNPVTGGVITSLSNPFFPLWWGTAGLALMGAAGRHGMTGQTVFMTGHLMADLAWYTMVSSMVHFGRSYLNDRRYRILVGILAAVIGFYGIWFIGTGTMKLAG